MNILLEIIKGPLTGKKFSIDWPGSFIFGRGSNTHFTTNHLDRSISRQHFEIRYYPPKCTIVHLSKKNPTYLNQKKIEQADINDLDLIGAGQSLIKLTFLNGSLPDKPEDSPGSFVTDSGSFCYLCYRDLSEKANNDGRATELINKVTYCCEECLPASKYVKGDKIGKYALIRHIAAGGMSNVYLVYHTETARLLVLKLMAGSLDDSFQRKHFLREISIHKELLNLNITHCIDADFNNKAPYIVLEYANCGNLHEYYLKHDFKVPLKTSIAFFLATLDGCKYIHNVSTGIVHRDFKPWNLLLKSAGNRLILKISDFGLSKFFGSKAFTKVGDVKGSIVFMSPHHLANVRDANFQDDIFSLGVSFYYLLSGKYPYHTPSPFEAENLSKLYKSNQNQLKFELDKLGRKNNIMQLVLDGFTIPLQEKAAHLDPGIVEIINKAISQDPELRYPDAVSFRKDLYDYYKNL
jgi:serine/threonine protein kinase